MFDALKLILDKKIGSVIIIDDSNHPIGIITTGDFFNLLRKIGYEKPIEITTKNLSYKSQRAARKIFAYASNIMRKFPHMQKAKVVVQEAKNGGLFKVMLAFIPKKGEPTIYQEEGKNLEKVLKKIKEK